MHVGFAGYIEKKYQHIVNIGTSLVLYVNMLWPWKMASPVHFFFQKKIVIIIWINSRKLHISRDCALKKTSIHTFIYKAHIGQKKLQKNTICGSWPGPVRRSEEKNIHKHSWFYHFYHFACKQIKVISLFYPLLVHCEESVVYYAVRHIIGNPYTQCQ